MPSSAHKPSTTTTTTLPPPNPATPTRARSTSLGPGIARRGPQKAHIPFRADDLERGKKTGIEVAYLDHKSDEFEPFSEIIGLADGRSPRGKKGKARKSTGVVGEGEDGEMSMELDHSTPASPSSYFTRAASPSTSTGRVLGHPSTNPLPRSSSDVDFDSVPSPRPSSRFRRAGPSNLSKSTVPDDHEDMDMDDYDPPENTPPASHAQRTPRKSSFSAMDETPNADDSEEEVEQATSPKPQPPSSAYKSNAHNPTRTPKGKEKARPAPSPSPPVPASDDLPQYQPEPQDYDQDQGQDYDMGVEDDIAQGLREVEHGPDDDERSGEDNEEEEEEERPAKKGKLAKGKEKEKPKDKGKAKETNTKTKKNKENREKKIREIPREGSSPPPGVRRGQRHRYRPLDWWRQERVVYGRRESGVTFVPHIKEIIRIPQDPPRPLGMHAQGKRKRSTTRGKSESRGADDKALMAHGGGGGRPGEVYNPEEGWDDDTDPTGVVLDYITKEEVSRRIAFTAKMVRPKAAANNDWFFQKVFGDGEFIAAGQLIIPPKGRKPSKGTKDNTYVFYVIEGAVNLKVHETTLVLTTGAMFLVPRGNTYFIENIGDRDAKLFFTQARKVALDEEEGDEGTVVPAPGRSSESVPRRLSVQRSSSVAVPSGSGGAKEAGGKVRRAMSTKA